MAGEGSHERRPVASGNAPASSHPSSPPFSPPSSFDTSRPGVVRCILWHAKGSILPGPLVAALDRPTVQWKAWDSDLLTLAEVFRPDALPPGAADQFTTDARAKVVVLVDPLRLPGLGAVLETLERHRPGTTVWVYEGSGGGGGSPRLQGVALATVRERFVRPGAGALPGQLASVPQPQPWPQVVTKPLGRIVPKPLSPADAFEPGGPGGPVVPEGPVGTGRNGAAPPLRLVDDVRIEVAPARAADQRSDGEFSGMDDSGPTPDHAAGTLLTGEELEMLLAEDPEPPARIPTKGAKPGKPGGTGNGKARG